MSTKCDDCGVDPGAEHEDGCDIARCLWTGGQRLMCGGGDHDCGRDVWTGLWPGSAECREFGWWTYWGPDVGEEGWQQLPPSEVDAFMEAHPKAYVTEDYNRLVTDATWDRSAHRWRIR